MTNLVYPVPPEDFPREDQDNLRAMVSQRGGEPVPIPDPFGELSSVNPAVGLRTDSYANRVAQDFLHLTSPDGIEVTFTPGEALPEWARMIQAERLSMPNLDDDLLYGARPNADPGPKKAIRTQVEPLASGSETTE